MSLFTPARPRRAESILVLSMLSAGLLAGCASTPAQTPKPVAPAAVAPAAASGPVTVTALPGLTPAQRGERAQQLLGDGQLGPARAEIEALLADAPQDAVGRSLMRQLTEDPRHLLPGEPIAHTVAADETLPGLAERYLGDKTLFWALARYNGIPVPDALHVGQVLQIPRAPTHRAASHPGRAAGEPRGEHSVAPAKAAPVSPAHDPAHAARLRGEGLEALNRGQADRAVALLGQALQLDPDNAAAKRDLDRAQRIRAQLHARH